MEAQFYINPFATLRGLEENEVILNLAPDSEAFKVQALTRSAALALQNKFFGLYWRRCCDISGLGRLTQFADL